MGNGVGSVGSPVNQTPNTANSGAGANATARAQFGEALVREQCPPGLHRPSRFEPPCNYLRPPGQEPPKQDKPVGIPRYEGSDVPKGPMTTEKPADDYKKPTPKLEEKGTKLPDGPKHSEGLAKDQGGHLGGWEFKHDWWNGKK